MGGKKKVNVPDAPEYMASTYNTGGLFGSSTTNKDGTTYKSTNKISDLAKTSMNNWGNALSQLNNFNNRDFSKDANYQVYSNRLYDLMRENYNNNVLNTLANNGLMRTSGLQAATNSFNDTLAKQTADLYDRYSNNQLNYLNNRLSANQNTNNSLYNYITGINNGSQNQAQNLNNYNLSNYNNQLTAAQLQAAQGGGNGAMGALGGAMSGAQAGSALGPWGALGGAVIGGIGGYMANK